MMNTKESLETIRKLEKN